MICLCERCAATARAAKLEELPRGILLEQCALCFAQCSFVLGPAYFKGDLEDLLKALDLARSADDAPKLNR